MIVGIYFEWKLFGFFHITGLKIHVPHNVRHYKKKNTCNDNKFWWRCFINLNLNFAWRVLCSATAILLLSLLMWTNKIESKQRFPSVHTNLCNLFSEISGTFPWHIDRDEATRFVAANVEHSNEEILVHLSVDYSSKKHAFEMKNMWWFNDFKQLGSAYLCS